MTLSDYNSLFSASLIKQMSILSSNGISITNTNICSEQMSLEESLCSENNVRFGACEASCFSICIADLKHNFVGEWLDVEMHLYTDIDGYLQLQNGDYFLLEDGSRLRLTSADATARYGRFKVVSDKPSNDRRWRNIVAYDAMYDILNADVTEWYSSLTFPMTIKDFRDSFFKYFKINQEDIELINDSFIVEGGFTTEALSGKTVIEAVCELNGVFGHISKDGVFTYVSLPNGEDLTYKWYIDGTGRYEDYVTAEISGIKVQGSENDIGVSVGNMTNPYIITQNPLVYGSEATESLKNALNKLLTKIRRVSYRPFNVDTYGNPMLEVGTAITLNTRDIVINSYVLKRYLSGIQSLKDSISAEGEESQPTQVNNVQSQIFRTKGKVHEIEVDIDKLSSRISNTEEDVKAIDGELGNVYTKSETETLIEQTASGIEARASSVYETKTDAESKLNSANQTAKGYADAAEANANNATDTKLGGYYNKTETESLISQTASEISLAVSKDYETKTDARAKADTTIVSDTIHYLATSSANVDKSTSGWSDTIQTITPTNKYLWTYHTYTYGSGRTSDTTPVVTGVYGEKGEQGIQGEQGDKGDTGVGIDEVVTLRYSTNKETAPTAPTSNVTTYTNNVSTWTRGVPELGTDSHPDYIYMYTCDQIHYTDPSIGVNGYVWTTVVEDTTLTTFERRMSSAEQKITDDAIIQTVSDTILNATEPVIDSDGFEILTDTSGISSYLLLENGSYLLLQNGSKLILEDNTKIVCIDITIPNSLEIKDKSKIAVYINRTFPEEYAEYYKYIRITKDGITSKPEPIYYEDNKILKNEYGRGGILRLVYRENMVFNAVAYTGWWIGADSVYSDLQSEISQLAEEITLRVNNLVSNSQSQISITADAISSEVSRATEAEGELSSRVEQTATSITTQINGLRRIIEITLTPTYYYRDSSDNSIVLNCPSPISSADFKNGTRFALEIPSFLRELGSSVSDAFRPFTDYRTRDKKIVLSFSTEAGTFPSEIIPIYYDGNTTLTNQGQDGTTLHITYYVDKGVVVPIGDGINAYVKYTGFWVDADDSYNQAVTARSEISQTNEQIVIKVDDDTGKMVLVKLGLDADDSSGTEFKVEADNINLSANDVFNIMSGGTLNLTSENIAITSNNFSVDKNGNLTCSNATVNGTVNASNGTIGGWSISSDRISFTEGSNYVYFAPGIGDNKDVLVVRRTVSGVNTWPLVISSEGKLTARNIEATGVINATAIKFDNVLQSVVVAKDNHTYNLVSHSVSAESWYARINTYNNAEAIRLIGYDAGDWSGYTGLLRGKWHFQNAVAQSLTANDVIYNGTYWGSSVNTPLNNTSLNTTIGNIKSRLDSYALWKANHTLNNVYAFGYITTSGTDLYICLPVDFRSDVTAVKVTSITLGLRLGTGGYAGGSNGYDVPQSIVNSTTATISRYQKLLILQLPGTGWGTNNTTVSGRITVYLTVS